MTNKKTDQRVNHRATKSLEDAVAHFIADVENRLDEREASASPKSWYSLTDINPYLARLKAAYKEHVGDRPEVPRRPYERSVRKGLGPDGQETVERHESYGIVKISRASGGNRRMFGSSVRHPHYFTLSIYRGQRTAGEWGERFSTDGRVAIVEVCLSPAQFVEMITTMNMGEGIPCTILDVEGVPMEPTPDDAGSELKLIKEHFEERMVGVVDQMRTKAKELDKLLDKKSFTKDDKSAIRSIIGSALRMMDDAAPHTLKVFGEHSEKMVAKAKLEVEAFIQLAIHKAGIKAIKDSNGTLLLGEGDGEGNEG